MTLNIQSLLRHLKTRAVAITAIVLVSLLASLYGIAAKLAVPEEIAQQLDALAKKAEPQSEAAAGSRPCATRDAASFSSHWRNT